ncbi:MAG: hypothetical protein IPG81_18075 [Sandaracinaceae bacterium]|nr:hypothetical protein [Sandaracinaceae bacterium]
MSTSPTSTSPSWAFALRDLRNAGGVVDIARAHAFAATNGAERVHPDSEGQGTFQVELEVRTPLSEAEWAQNGLVLVEAVAVDASGNQVSISKLAFTGTDVNERALGLSPQPERLVLNSLLASEQIRPVVNFEFRGPTPLVGGGTGVRYVSSHPNLVGVTSSGVVYAVAATGSESVHITVSYPNAGGLSGEPAEWSVNVPVVVDPTLEVTALRIDELTPEGALLIPRLNSSQRLPRVFATFNNGSESEIVSQYPLAWSVLPLAEGSLEVIGGRVVAFRPLDGSAPGLSVAIAHLGRSADVPVQAVDALPEVSLRLPANAAPESRLELRPEITDDVGITSVRFFLMTSPSASEPSLPTSLAWTSARNSPVRLSSSTSRPRTRRVRWLYPRR